MAYHPSVHILYLIIRLLECETRNTLRQAAAGLSFDFIAVFRPSLSLASIPFWASDHILELWKDRLEDVWRRKDNLLAILDVFNRCYRRIDEVHVYGIAGISDFKRCFGLSGADDGLTWRPPISSISHFNIQHHQSQQESEIDRKREKRGDHPKCHPEDISHICRSINR